MAKRGRKRKGYFYEEQEQAVSDYINSHDKLEKNRIFNEWLKPAFTKMIESIIRRYKLYPPDECFDETFNDTISFLMTKIEKFNPDKGYRAYSYCGTICKNYLLFKLNQFKKHQSRQESYGDFYEVANDSDTYVMEVMGESNEDFLDSLIDNTCIEIKRIIENCKGDNLTADEERVGLALVELFENWDDIFQEMGSNKFNKSSILLYLKETTRLTTPEIRSGMRKYKAAYYAIKKMMPES